MRLSVNGATRDVDAEPTDVLVDVLRRAGHTEVKEGCSIGVCGACTVIVNGLPVSSCLYLAGCAEESEILTAKGVTTDDAQLVEAFADSAAFQCGFCTPGQVTMAWWLARSYPDADATLVRELLAGNLCRCTGYEAIIEGVMSYIVNRRAGSSTHP
ncbi:MAG: 2Fe-2S iron-sulfur cluster-binding protein [Actinomycetota bacterium]|nr:2Fe-2S iron-sulfur cluster-binding protein [Actinomycetota bacterium]